MSFGMHPFLPPPVPGHTRAAQEDPPKVAQEHSWYWYALLLILL